MIKDGESAEAIGPKQDVQILKEKPNDTDYHRQELFKEPQPMKDEQDSDTPEKIEHVIDELAATHPKIEYDMDPPGMQFKRELVTQYMKAAPFMYKVSNPATVHNLTSGDENAPEKSIICNEPKVNDWMI